MNPQNWPGLLIFLVAAFGLVSHSAAERSLPASSRSGGGVVWLEDLDLVAMASAAGTEPIARRSLGGGPLSIGGTTYPRGVSVRAHCEFTIDLKGAVSRFEAMVGVEENASAATGNDGSVQFQVWVDGRHVAATGVVRYREPAQPLSVDLAGARYLRLVVTNGGDGNEWDCAAWAEAKLLLQPGVTRWPVAVIRPEPALEIGHGGAVSALAVSPNGRTLTSLGGDGRLIFWDLETNREERSLDSKAANSIAFSPDGETLALGSWFKMVHCRNARTGEMQRILLGHQEVVEAVAFSPDGKLLASASIDGVVKLWSMETGKEVHGFSGAAAHPAVAFSPDGKLLAVTKRDHTVELRVVRSGQVWRTLTGHTMPLFSVAFSPDGQAVAAGAEDGVVRVWEANTAALRWTDTAATAGGAGEWVASLEFSPDSRTLVAAGRIGVVRFWDSRSGAVRRTLRGPHGFWTLTARYSRDGRTVLTGGVDNMVRIWDPATGAPRGVLGGAPKVTSLSWFPRTEMAATGHYDCRVRLWDTRTGELKRTLSGNDQGISSVAASPDAKTLAISDANGPVQLWDAQTGTVTRTLTGSYEPGILAFSPDGKLLAVGRTAYPPERPCDLRRWDLRAGSWKEPAMLHPASILSVEFSPDGRLIATGCHDGHARLWDVATGALKQTLSGHATPVDRLAFSPDGKLLATGGRNGVVQLWDPATGAPRRTIEPHGGAILGLAFSPDSQVLATSIGGVMLWDVKTGALLRQVESVRLGAAALAFSPGGERLVLGIGDGSLHVNDPHDGRLIATLVPLLAGDASAPTPPDVRPPADITKPLVTGAKDLGAWIGEEYVIVTREGFYTGSAGADRVVWFQVGRDRFPAESFHAYYYRPEVVRQALAGKQPVPLEIPNGAYPPVVGVTVRQSEGAAAGLQLDLTATDDSDVMRVELFFDGKRVDSRPIEVDAKPLTVGAKPLTVGAKLVPAAHRQLRAFRVTVPLPPGGRTLRVRAVALDDDGFQSQPHEVLFTPSDMTPAPATAGRLLGLCVGVRRYATPRLDLEYADRDATALAQALNAQRGIYSAAQVTSLTNEQATRQKVLAALDSLVAQATPVDTVLVFLSGHGMRNGEKTFFFATHEVDPASQAAIAQTALPWAEVLLRLARLSEKSRRVLVLLDACHSGSAATNEDLVTALIHARAGVMVLASSKGSELSREKEALGHGVFTYALLEGIRGAGTSEATVTIWDFAHYVRRRVKELTGGEQNPVPFLQDFDLDAPISGRA